MVPRLSQWSRRSLLLALTVSVGVNLFVIGWALGAFLAPLGDRHAGPPPPMADMDPRTAAATARLSPEGQAAVAELFASLRGSIPEFRREMDPLREEAFRLVQQPEVDTAAVEAVLDHMRQRLDARMARTNADLIAFVTRLSPEDRARLDAFRDGLLPFGPVLRGPPPESPSAR